MSWKLYEGDCFDYLPLIEDKSVDMVLCDLPYGTTACKWDTPLPLDELWFEYKRVIKDNGAIVLTASQPFTSKLVSSNYDMFKYSWIWKKSPTGFLNSSHQPLRNHEDILIFYNNVPTYNSQRIKPIKWKTHRNKPIGKTTENYGEYKELIQDVNYFAFPTSIIENIKKEDCNLINHPTQKPVALFEYLIKTYTNEGDLVLDNCAGSGTTGVACENLNRNSILMEQEPDYCQIIKERMKEAEELRLEQRKQTSLNAFSGQQTLVSHAK